MFTPGDLVLNGAYRIETELGHGACGVVYRATHIGLNVPRAIKTLRHDAPGVGSTLFADYRNRFTIEAQLAARLTHTNVIQVHDFHEQAGVLFSVMEYAPGGSLANLLAQKTPIAIARVVSFLREAALGLQAIHDELDAVHRDVKPSNLLLDGQGHLKVADLGLAQVRGLSLTHRSLLGDFAPVHPGTPNYASPEHQIVAEPLGATVDVYGLGCVAFELLTGQAWKRARRKVERASDLRADVPPWLDGLVERMVCEVPGVTRRDATDAARRFVDMQGVLDAIDRMASAPQRASSEAATERERVEVAARVEAQRKAQEEARQREQAAIAEQARVEAASRAEAATRHKQAEVLARTATPIWPQIGVELIRIPAGKFLYGEGKARVHVDEFYIAKTAVTNAQYKAFVDATGHSAPEHWIDGRIPSGKENHPVVYVNWHEAQAFCTWAGLKLPTGRQWEKAARGTDGRIYPWGNEDPDASRCNFNRNVSNTTPVGTYPSGASPYGLLDMAGNVWEWCEDWDETTGLRLLRWTKIAGRCVLRGGSIIAVDRNALAWIGFVDPYDMERTMECDMGFRCVRSKRFPWL